MKGIKSRINHHLILVVSLTAIAFCVLLSFIFISQVSTIMLVVFNLLFVSLTFPLKRALIRKVYLLLIGNIVGLCWNYLLLLLAYYGVYYLGEFFNALYAILSPFANLMWIVSFWSISLTMLYNSENRKLGIKIDN